MSPRFYNRQLIYYENNKKMLITPSIFVRDILVNNFNNIKKKRKYLGGANSIL